MSWGDFIELRMLGTTSQTMTLKMSASDKIQSLENHNYHTSPSTNLVQCSFSSLSNSLDEHFSNFFLFDSLKRFYWKEIFWTIITTIPVIVYS